MPPPPRRCRRRETLALAAVALTAVMVIYRAKRKHLMRPTAEEQAWLDQQLASSSSGLTLEEEKWLDKQVSIAEADDMLDDARQAGTPRTASAVCHGLPACAHAMPIEKQQNSPVHPIPPLARSFCAR